MPTHEELPRFRRDWTRLTGAQRSAFLEALVIFVAGLALQSLDPRLRVKRVQGHPGIWEMSWADDGRATFQYGQEIRSGGAARHLASNRNARSLPDALTSWVDRAVRPGDELLSGSAVGRIRVRSAIPGRLRRLPRQPACRRYRSLSSRLA